MDFAPYQDQSPETNRALSPSHTSHPSSNPWDTSGHVPARAFGSADAAGFGAADLEGGRGGLNDFETSLPIRLDYEACLAYLLLPPAGGVLLLVMEHKSDYVRLVGGFVCESVSGANNGRFHAWQSALLFSSIFVLHLILSWSSFLSWTMFVADILLVGYLTLRAYRDGRFWSRLCWP